jgi:uncharacterized protein
VRGFVYLTEQDLRRAAKFLNISPKRFEKEYVIRYPNLLRLRKPLDSQCHFLTKDGCSIHPVKPTQCRLYPFWPELVETAAAWQAESQRCPGIGQGRLVQIGSALEAASEMKTAYPSMY